MNEICQKNKIHFIPLWCQATALSNKMLCLKKKKKSKNKIKWEMLKRDIMSTKYNEMKRSIASYITEYNKQKISQCHMNLEKLKA